MVGPPSLRRVSVQLTLAGRYASRSRIPPSGVEGTARLGSPSSFQRNFCHGPCPTAQSQSFKRNERKRDGNWVPGCVSRFVIRCNNDRSRCHDGAVAIHRPSTSIEGTSSSKRDLPPPNTTREPPIINCKTHSVHTHGSASVFMDWRDLFGLQTIRCKLELSPTKW